MSSTTVDTGLARQHRRRPDAGGRRWSSATTTSRRSPRRSAASPSGPRRRGPGTSAFAVALALTGVLFAMIGYLVDHRRRRLGRQQPGRLGLGHRQLRLLGRHRPRRHADLGHPVPVPPEVAHQHQPLRRGDDHLRRDLRRPLPGDPRRPRLAGLLARSRSRTRCRCGRTSAARCCGTCSPSAPTATVSLLFWYMGMIPDLATLRDRATTRMRQVRLRRARLGWRGSNRHWHRYERAYLLLAALATPLVLSRALGGQLRLRRLAAARAGTPRSSRPTSSPAPSSAASPWW